jgi:hypothetical protein
MMNVRTRLLVLLGAALAFGSVARASEDPGVDAQVGRIDSEWARIKYQVRDSSRQYDQLKAL